MLDLKLKFTPTEFVPTQWDTAEAKAKFANQFVRFVGSDFEPKKFPKWFYQRLSMTFGHIAHFNQMGFYETFFTSNEGKIRFLLDTLQGGGYGDPAFTYSDVEKALKAALPLEELIREYQRQQDAARLDAERAEYARLKQKFEPQSHEQEDP